MGKICCNLCNLDVNIYTPAAKGLATCVDHPGHGVHLVVHYHRLWPREHLHIGGQVAAVQDRMEGGVRLVYEPPASRHAHTHIRFNSCILLSLYEYTDTASRIVTTNSISSY